MFDLKQATPRQTDDHRARSVQWTFRQTWPLDVGLVATVIIAIATRSVVVSFHVIFLLLAMAALMLPFHQFAIRTSLGMAASSALVIWAVTSFDVPSEELTEIPLLTAVLVLIFLVARSRADATTDRAATQDELAQRADAELDDLRRRLVHSQRLDILGRTSAGLAHDLRNVFTVVEGCAEDFRAIDDPSVTSCATEVSDACTRGKLLVDELLWVGRQHHTAPAVIDLGAAVTELRPILQRLTRRGVRLDVRAPRHVVHVRVDKMSITQILMNLVANANDAIVGPTGRITVAVHTLLTNNAGAGVTMCAALTVTDDGQGFDPTTAQNAFTAEFTTKGTDHSGLGLHTVAQLADRFGGSVRVESGDSTETVVSVTIPIEEATSASGADGKADTPKACSGSLLGSATDVHSASDLDGIASRSFLT